jgi:hypothetical protein
MKLIRIINLLFLISSCSSIFSQNGKVKQEKLSKFELQSSSLISEPGEVLSTSGYKSNVYWFPVTVPSTVLTGLVANRV